MKLELVFRKNSETSLLEHIIINLMQNGICKVYSKDKKDATIMSTMYVFSRERVARALANLCNNEIISVDFRDNVARFTPIFQRLLTISQTKTINEIEGIKTNEVIGDYVEKLKILKSVEPSINFFVLFGYVDLRLV